MLVRVHMIVFRFNHELVCLFMCVRMRVRSRNVEYYRSDQIAHDTARSHAQKVVVCIYWLGMNETRDCFKDNVQAQR